MGPDEVEITLAIPVLKHNISINGKSKRPRHYRVLWMEKFEMINSYCVNNIRSDRENETFPLSLIISN